MVGLYGSWRALHVLNRPSIRVLTARRKETSRRLTHPNLVLLLRLPSSSPPLLALALLASAGAVGKGR